MSDVFYEMSKVTINGEDALQIYKLDLKRTFRISYIQSLLYNL